MSHARPRLGRHSLVLAIAMLLASAAGANATTAEYSGSTLIIKDGGANASHEIQFRLSDDATHDEIIDTVPFTSIPSDCDVVVANTWISCPGHLNVQVDLGSGNDFVTTAHSTNGDCFITSTFNLGEGANGNDMNTGCADAGATATINSGSGDDDLRGGSASTSVTINAGGGADTVNAMDGPTVIHGGEGNDGVFGGSGNDQVFGEGGDDRLRGHGGNDLEDGGPGNDDIGYSPRHHARLRPGRRPAGRRLRHGQAAPQWPQRRHDDQHRRPGQRRHARRGRQRGRGHREDRRNHGQRLLHGIRGPRQLRGRLRR